jgi:DNA-binding IclR family transcriptional regulator
MSDAPGATRTVQRALRLLGAVTDTGGTLSDLARAVELSPSTTPRLLSKLMTSQFIRRRVKSIGRAVARDAGARSQSLGAPPQERVA